MRGLRGSAQSPPYPPRRGCAHVRWRSGAFIAAPGRPDRRMPVGRFAAARQRQVEKSRGGTDGRVPGTSYCGEISLSRGVP
jgi:hypothetical protein